MRPQYEDWMKSHVPQTPEGQLAQCTNFVPLMAEAFPELTICRGVVSSPVNVDNFGGVDKEYPHMWLRTPEGEIVDPTVLQFSLSWASWTTGSSP